MTQEEEKRLEEIENLLISIFRKRNECLRKDDKEQAEVYSQALFRLDRERSDIKEGIKPIMDERKKELLDKLNVLNVEVETAGFFRRHKLFSEINETIDDLAEFRLRNYARSKVKKKTLDK